MLFQGLRIDNVVKEEIKVMVGRDNCVVETTADTAITCFAPQRDKPVMEKVTVSATLITCTIVPMLHCMQVSFGLNINTVWVSLSTLLVLTLVLTLLVLTLLLLLEELLVEWCC